MPDRVRCPVCNAPLKLVADPDAVGPIAGKVEATPLRGLEAVIRDHVMLVFRAHHGNRRETAQTLGVNPSTLYRWLTNWSRNSSAHPRLPNEQPKGQ